ARAHGWSAAVECTGRAFCPGARVNSRIRALASHSRARRRQGRPTHLGRCRGSGRRPVPARGFGTGRRACGPGLAWAARVVQHGAWRRLAAASYFERMRRSLAWLLLLLATLFAGPSLASTPDVADAKAADVRTGTTELAGRDAIVAPSEGHEAPLDAPRFS